MAPGVTSQGAAGPPSSPRLPPLQASASPQPCTSAPGIMVQPRLQVVGERGQLAPRADAQPRAALLAFLHVQPCNTQQGHQQPWGWPGLKLHGTRQPAGPLICGGTSIRDTTCCPWDPRPAHTCRHLGGRQAGAVGAGSGFWVGRRSPGCAAPRLWASRPSDGPAPLSPPSAPLQPRPQDPRLRLRPRRLWHGPHAPAPFRRRGRWDFPLPRSPSALHRIQVPRHRPAR